MKQAQDNRDVPKRYYRPEQTTCPRCGRVLKRCYPLWRKYVVFLDGRYLVVSMGYQCPHLKCAGHKRVFASQAARRVTVRGSSFALEVIVQIGFWRFWKRWTVTQIHEVLTQARGLPISEREVLYLIGVFRVLLRSTNTLRLAERALQLAVAHVFPGVRHQTCQSHCLRDAATLVVEADQAFKKAVKQAIRSPFYAACRALSSLAPEDPSQAVLNLYAELIRSTLTEGSKPPFALGGLRVFEDLARLEASLIRSQKKGTIAYWINSWPWSNAAGRLRRNTGGSSASGTRGAGRVGTAARPTGRQPPDSAQVKDFLAELEAHARLHPDEANVAAHICATFRQRWPRLFACYGWPERYRTNNDLETFFGRLRTRQRQIHGRKSVHEFILRYGAWAVFIDPTETFEQVLDRFQQFDQLRSFLHNSRCRWRKRPQQAQMPGAEEAAPCPGCA